MYYCNFGILGPRGLACMLRSFSRHVAQSVNLTEWNATQWQVLYRQHWSLQKLCQQTEYFQLALQWIWSCNVRNNLRQHTWTGYCIRLSNKYHSSSFSGTREAAKAWEKPGWTCPKNTWNTWATHITKKPSENFCGFALTVVWICP